jgi:GNAT superfamily N-acetyltransferase
MPGVASREGPFRARGGGTKRALSSGMGHQSEIVAPADLTIREVSGAAEQASVLPLLLLAEPSERALHWSLTHLSDVVYGAQLGEELAGAATLNWTDDPAEIVELAIARELQGQGLGRRFIEWLATEAARRGKSALTVGTTNASLGNISFYQKCGFRMDQIRRDYFWYYEEPRVENGIVVRDMIVFRRDLPGGVPRRGARRGRERLH